MSSVRVVLRKEKKRKNGHLPIYIRVIENRKPKYISLRHAIDPIYWDEIQEQVVKTYPQAGMLNALIREKRMEVERLAFEVQLKGKQLPETSIRSALMITQKESARLEWLRDRFNCCAPNWPPR